MRKVLAVTGITGHSGRYFLRELINAKYPDTLRCLIRESSDTKEIDGSGLDIEKVIGELPNTKVINHLVNGADTVLHIARICSH